MSRVFVAMSGGVDSSVAAALLLEAGHDVTGVTMQLWPSGDDEGGCCSISAVRDAKRVCDLLGIAHYALNYRDVFEREVVTPFAEEYAAGRTPNPCVVCNDRVKFSDLLAKVAAQGADFLATGHYARIVAPADGRGPALARALDPDKDQSYFLYRLTAAQLERVLFPVGELHKPDVRSYAARIGLAVAEKPDSQEVCFAPAGEHAAVLARHAPGGLEPGEIVDTLGRVLGRHDGVGRFTVGQRKGLGIGGAGEPLYVLGIDAEANRVIAGPRQQLRVSMLEASSVVWRGASGTAAAGSATTGSGAAGGVPVAVEAAVRYRMAGRAAHARVEGDRLYVEFDEPLEGVAPGQAVVCYDGDLVVGGGVIECAS